MNINEKIYQVFEVLMTESQHAITDNPGRGFHGTVDLKVHASKKKPVNPNQTLDDEQQRAKHYRNMHSMVRTVTGTDAKTAKHYLDSVHGRHLADVHNDNATRKLAASHVTNYIKKDFEKFKKHYKPELFEEEMLDKGEELQEATYTSSNYDKHNDHPSKSSKTFIKGVHGDEHEHVSVIKKTAGVSHEHAKKIAHSPEYHAHAYNYRHDFSRGGSNGYDNGVKKLGGTHPHYPGKEGAIKEEENLEEMSDSGSFKPGDKVRVDTPNSPHHNKRGIYKGTERGRHVVMHSDGTRSLHGAGALLKESTAGYIKSIVEEMKSADKKPETVRTSNGKLVTKLVTRKHDVVDAGGKDGHNETENR